MTTRTWAGLAAFSLISLGLTAAPDNASALDCSARPVDAKSEWVYRTIEGRKCWYRGTKVIPKSELRWADAEKPQPPDSQVRNAQASLVPVAPPILPTTTNDERHPAILDVNVKMLDVNVDQADTFEARWRGWPR